MYNKKNVGIYEYNAERLSQQIFWVWTLCVKFNFEGVILGATLGTNHEQVARRILHSERIQ